MPDRTRSLDRVRIASPCNADWDAMIGNDQVRFCEHCNLLVSDLSTMTRPDAMRLVARSQGRLCVRYIQKPDGGVLTKQIPQKLHRIGRRVSRIAAGAFTATLSVSGVAAQTRSESSSTKPVVAATVAEALPSQEIGATIAGVITDPNGALVSGAILTLRNAQTLVGFTYVTGDDGTYRFPFLQSGTYSLTVDAPGFDRTEMPEVVLEPNVGKSLDFSMQLPELTEQGEIETNTVVVVTATMGVVGFAEPEDPLVKAAFTDDLDAVKALAFTSSDVDASDKATGANALAHAIEHGNREMVQVLLSAGASVNAKSRYGQAALMNLGQNATVDLLSDLLSAGAKVNARDDSGATALMAAVASCSFEVVKGLIAAGAKIDTKDNSARTVIMNAALSDDVRILQLLIDAGSDVDASDDSGETALTMAVRWGRLQIVKALIRAGAKIDKQNSDGKNAILFAAGIEEPQIAQMLIDAGADVNSRDKEGTSALMLAATDGAAATVKALISAGAEINAKDNDGWTALMRANKVENVLVLLNEGADMTVKNNDGQTALGLARKYEQEEIVKLLESRGAPE